MRRLGGGWHQVTLILGARAKAADEGPKRDIYFNFNVAQVHSRLAWPRYSQLQVHFMLPPVIAVRFGCTPAWRGLTTLMRLQFTSGQPAWRGLTLLCDLPCCRLQVTLPPAIAVRFGCTPVWRGLTTLMQLQSSSGTPQLSATSRHTWDTTRC